VALQWHDRSKPNPDGRGLVNRDGIPLLVPGSSQEIEDPSPRMLKAVSLRQIERVVVLPGEGIGSKPSFEISLELGQNLDTSSPAGRTWRETSLELEIEERELASFARLTGKNLMIRSLRNSAELRLEDLQREIQNLKDENQKLRQRKASLEEQLQFAVDQLRSS